VDDVDRPARLDAWFRAHADRVLAYLLHRTDPEPAGRAGPPGLAGPVEDGAPAGVAAALAQLSSLDRSRPSIARS
jgi:hypothetical protein